jgi:tetrahydromethanopterin S-methyltransferase subunit D
MKALIAIIAFIVVIVSITVGILIMIYGWGLSPVSTHDNKKPPSKKAG